MTTTPSPLLATLDELAKAAAGDMAVLSGPDLAARRSVEKDEWYGPVSDQAFAFALQEAWPRLRAIIAAADALRDAARAAFEYDDVNGLMSPIGAYDGARGGDGEKTTP